MDLYTALLVPHVGAGALTLAGAAGAIATKTPDLPHRWHALFGTCFVVGMTVIFLTALPMAVMSGSLFLFLISIFSFYLAAAGWRLARNRTGAPNALDWIRAWGMVVVSGLMVGTGALFLVRGNPDGITLAVFGALGVGLSVSRDLRGLRAGGFRGRERIAGHLGMMMGGTIAALTAFLVTVFTFDPAFVLWLAPTAVLVPVIIWWTRRIRAGVRPRGMVAE
jgi:hypothetical protein